MTDGSGSVLRLMDPDPGGPKTYGSYGSGSTTLLPVPTMKNPYGGYNY